MHGLPVGVVILTRDFVCEKLAMDDVHRLLRRVDRDSGGKYPFVLIPVFLGVSPDECEDLLHRVYSDPDLWKAQPGHPRSHPKPNQATLTKWAGWARQLTCTGVAKQPQQVDDMKSYAEMVADECERHLILSGRIKRPSDVPKAALQTPVVAALIGTNAKQPRTHGHESYEEAVW
ncbi:hypothetical protein WJX72_008141 [[Myrmecia] bisecta]|uniref:TIR domain-containing protein n=1 Tax=[Myrmecia] bisecta TaxID=41462 RepID=A0AAW1PLI0_9CHLO